MMKKKFLILTLLAAILLALNSTDGVHALVSSFENIYEQDSYYLEIEAYSWTRRSNQTATAYNVVGTTASGRQTAAGMVAVGIDTSGSGAVPRLPFGTQIRIISFRNGRQINSSSVRIGTQNLSDFVVEDMGSGAPGHTTHWLDFWLPENDSAVRNFGMGVVTYEHN